MYTALNNVRRVSMNWTYICIHSCSFNNFILLRREEKPFNNIFYNNYCLNNLKAIIRNV